MKVTGVSALIVPKREKKRWIKVLVENQKRKKEKEKEN